MQCHLVRLKFGFAFASLSVRSIRILAAFCRNSNRSASRNMFMVYGYMEF